MKQDRSDLRRTGMTSTCPTDETNPAEGPYNILPPQLFKVYFNDRGKFVS